MVEDYSAFHFLLGNPIAETDYLSVPKLLRRTADAIDELGDVEIQGLMLRIDFDPVFDLECVDEMCDSGGDNPLLDLRIIVNGPDPTMSVYYSRGPRYNAPTLPSQRMPRIHQGPPRVRRRIAVRHRPGQQSSGA